MLLSKDDIAERSSCITDNNAISMHVGKSLHLRHTLIGMSKEQPGVELNVTSQQVWKQERGVNRISTSRMWDISQILDVPISYFSIICRKAQCAVNRKGSAMAIVRAR